MGPIPDHIQAGLSILFIGFNPSIRSGESGHHYANPRNRFWRILHLAGLTKELYKAEQDKDLLKIGYGFTNIVARPTRTADEIKAEEYQEGRIILLEKLRRYRPKIACFVGKGVYEQYRQARDIVWGVQPNPLVSGVIEFVAPSSSGLVRMPLAEVVEIYKEIKTILRNLEEKQASDCP